MYNGQPITVTQKEVLAKAKEHNLNPHDLAQFLNWAGAKANEYVIRANGMKMSAVNGEWTSEVVQVNQPMNEHTVHPEFAVILFDSSDGAIGYSSIGDDMIEMARVLRPTGDPDAETVALGEKLEKEVFEAAGLYGTSNLLARMIRLEEKRIRRMAADGLI